MLTSLWVRLLAVLLLLTAVVAGGLSVRKAYAERALFRTQLEAERAVVEDFKARVHASYRLAERRSQDAERIRTVTKEITREVLIRIPADAAPLPPAWRVLHDAAAEGRSPAPAGGPDAAPVPAQDAASTVIENYGTFHDTADRLVKLQQYVKEQCK